MTATLPSALAHGHVHVLDPAEESLWAALNDGSATQTPVTWVIRDADGVSIETVTGVRSAAIRRMGALAHHGASLPLILFGADGRPTGDRLPG